ncbi:hypothetical protein J2Z66_002829 [Paenibacillus eucommiae]|uniref:Fibronectin type-III domain-containing protein n=1 Tax=Paenibacillus eucommiae TaxID=1355755 RepID=A0ABS4IUF4_9BACL|nr:hypothetical protein [Paenibacillus eucommiae]
MATANVGVTGYRIYLDDNREPVFETITGNVYLHTVVNLKPGTIYTFIVKAYNSAGENSGLISQATTVADKTELNAKITEASPIVCQVQRSC